MTQLWFRLLFIAIGLLSCESRKTNLEVLTGNLGISKDQTKAIIIVPLDGCNGCIDKTLDYIKQAKLKEGHVFVLTDYGSKRAKMLGLNTDFSNVYIDSSAQAKKMDLVRFYPVLHTLKDDQTYARFELNGSNIDSVFSKLISQH